MTVSTDWQIDNHQTLMTHLARLRQLLMAHADPDLITEDISPPDSDPSPSIPSSRHASPSALDQICNGFCLSPFERDLLLLCAGIELDASFRILCAAAQGDAQRTYPTFSLALAVLQDAHWSALTPMAPLRRWKLLEVGTGASLTFSPLRIDEWVLHYLVGVLHMDERLLGFVEPVEFDDDLVLSHWGLAEQMVAAWSLDGDVASLPILQLCGNEIAGKRAIAATACHFAGLHLYTLPGYAVPTQFSDLVQFRHIWEREAALVGNALMIECDELEDTDVNRDGAITYLSESLRSPVILTSSDRRHARQRPMLTFDVYAPESHEQHQIWQAALGDALHTQLNGQVERMVAQFNLTGPAIQAACSKVRAEWERSDQDADVDPVQTLAKNLWDTCRSQARPRLEDMAQRIDCSADWTDLVLPDTQIQILKELSGHVHQRSRVYDEWGFGGKSKRGLGTSALFAGGSGTGKTMASEVLAKQLNLDLYRIDLSAVVSKYIGETEKNLRRVFDAAESGGAILLFDEADALFGKRSEVKDSHDRHANVEVSYLLQRMESYRGLSILTTNLKSALDTAFLRRLRFVIQFPFPDATQRTEIWRRVFPKKTPTEGLVPEKLAQLNVAGGNIRNIAVNAAFMAAEDDEPVMMKHLLMAAKAEYMKLERPLTDTEVRGWVATAGAKS
ncbi:MAG: ATP-binding protein [Cyanobacteria bacterium P01_A01_bin.37]